MLTKHFVQEQTAFMSGNFFTSEAEVREYFDPENIMSIFGPHCEADAAALEEMADAVISNRWHCNF